MDIHGLHFADPVWLLGLFALPLLAAAVFFVSRAKYSTFSLGNPRLVEMASSILSFQITPWVFRFAVVALCLIAAARPQLGQKKVEEKKPVTDLFVALDLSSSMIQDDLKPNRITAAKKILSDFLDKVQNARVGLTVFARISFTQCPLTTDVNVVKELLSKADIFTVRLDGTAIGDALVSSLGRLQSGGAKPQTEPSAASSLVSKLLQATPTSEENKPNSQAIILLTDGADNASQVDPLTAAKIAASRGVKIYTIGMGSRERVPALLMRPDGTTTFGIDPRTRQVMMSEPLNMTLLNEVARVTGGKSYAATDNHSLQAILDEIARLEKRDVTVTSHWEYQELAAYFLLAAFFLLAVDIALGMTLLRTLP